MSSALGPARALRRLNTLAPPADRGRLGVAVVAGVLATTSGIALVATSAYLISRAALQPPILELTLAIVGVRAFALGRAVFRYLERLASHDAALRLLGGVRARVYRRLEPLAPAGLGSDRVGDLLSRLVRDVDALQGFYVRGLAPPMAAIVAAALTVAGIWLALPNAGLALAAAMGGAALILLISAHRAGSAAGCARARSAGGLARARGAVSTEVVELLEGAPELIAFGAEARQLRRIQAAASRLQRIEASSIHATAGLEAAITLLSGLAVWLVLVVAIPAVRSGSLSGLLLAVVALAALAAFDAIAPLPLAIQELTTAAQAASRVFSVIDRDPPVSDPVAPAPAPVGRLLALERARLRYPGRTSFALDGVDLTLSAGRRVALVGPSGAGKTTIANVLLRFRELDSGTARLDGREMREYSQDDVRKVVGLMSQDAHLFNTTILENVKLGRPQATMGEVEDAAARARLLAWIRTLPDGWNTRVGERGALVSGGQRQRIALARTLLAGFPILVADEPAAHLDDETADGLTADLLWAQSGGAVLLISHRLTGLDAVDEVLVLDAGRVVQRGTHADLVSGPGLYRRLLEVAAGE